MSCCWRWLLVYGGFRWLHQPARSAEIARPSIYSPRGSFIFPISARSDDRFFSPFFPFHPRSSKEYFDFNSDFIHHARRFNARGNLQFLEIYGYVRFQFYSYYIYGFDIVFDIKIMIGVLCNDGGRIETVSFRINFSPNFWTSVHSLLHDEEISMIFDD